VDHELQLRTFPSDDDEFQAFVNAAVAAARSSWAALAGNRVTIADSRSLVAEVEKKLHARYPDAAIRVRTEFAALDPTEPELLYVYRDGSLVA
jgi:hypothetical protein